MHFSKTADLIKMKLCKDVAEDQGKYFTYINFIELVLIQGDIIDVVWNLVKTLTLVVFEDYDTEFLQTLYDYKLPLGPLTFTQDRRTRGKINTFGIVISISPEI